MAEKETQSEGIEREKGKTCWQSNGMREEEKLFAERKELKRKRKGLNKERNERERNERKGKE